jgi:hypothetical protein
MTSPAATTAPSSTIQEILAGPRDSIGALIGVEFSDRRFPSAVTRRTYGFFSTFITATGSDPRA